MASDIFAAIHALRQQGVLAALATVVDRKGSTPAKLAQKMVVRADGSIIGTIGGGCLEADVIRAARDVMDTGLVRTMQFNLSGEEAERSGLACGGTISIMIEPINDPEVFVIGCGHVGVKIATLAKQANFKVTAVDDRADFADAQELAHLDEVICCPLEDLAKRVPVGPLGFIVSATRGHQHDFQVLRWALETPARFIGVLGSRSKGLQFRTKLKELGFSTAQCESFACPVGLPIGADNPDEIAVSIVASLIAKRRLNDADAKG